VEITRKVILLSFVSLLLMGAGWPLKEKAGLTSSFGEWRDGHLHAGFDLPTGRTNKEVYSVTDGWVMRARTSPWGYGKAIYVKDSLGRVFVYAHLSSFAKDLDKRVRGEQLKGFSYETDLWFKKGEMPMKEGKMIGMSGRSGCLSPHLHFEMRDKGNNPIDPLVRGFSFPDTIPPVIYALRFVPLDDTATVCGSHLGIIIPVRKDTPVVSIKGRAGLEIETYDKVNGHSGQLGPKEIELYLDNQLVRREYFDRFSYMYTGDSRLEFDYPYRRRTGRKFRRLFTLLGNELPFYEGRDGIFTSKDNGLVSIIVRDGASNEVKTQLFLENSFSRQVTPREEIRFEKAVNNVDKIMILNCGILIKGLNSFRWIKSGKIKGIVKSGDSILVWNIRRKRYPSYKSPDSRCILKPSSDAIINTDLVSVRMSPVRIAKDETRWIWEPTIPLNKRTPLEITLPYESSYYSIYELNGTEWKYCHTHKEGNKLKTTIDHLGTFTILKDSVPPVISIKNHYFTLKVPLMVYVSDSLSGVDFYSIKTYINEMPTVFRYDLQMDRLIFEYPGEIAQGKHTLNITLKDRQGNKASGEWEITKGD